MTTGAEMIAAERARQIAVEGYDREHDAGHAGELMRAAQSYVGAAIRATRDDASIYQVPVMWPWADGDWKPSTTPHRNLEKAGALIAAALDSLHPEPGGSDCG